MKRKELEKLAKTIVEAEKVISDSSFEEEVNQAKEKITFLSNKIRTMEDMFLLDEMIQKIISKKNS